MGNTESIKSDNKCVITELSENDSIDTELSDDDYVISDSDYDISDSDDENIKYDSNNNRYIDKKKLHIRFYFDFNKHIKIIGEVHNTYQSYDIFKFRRFIEKKFVKHKRNIILLESFDNDINYNNLTGIQLIKNIFSNYLYKKTYNCEIINCEIRNLLGCSTSQRYPDYTLISNLKKQIQKDIESDYDNILRNEILKVFVKYLKKKHRSEYSSHPYTDDNCCRMMDAYFVWKILKINPKRNNINLITYTGAWHCTGIMEMYSEIPYYLKN